MGDERQQDEFGEARVWWWTALFRAVRAIAVRAEFFDWEHGVSRMLSACRSASLRFNWSSRLARRTSARRAVTDQSAIDLTSLNGPGNSTGYSDHERQSLEAGCGAPRLEIPRAASHGVE